MALNKIISEGIKDGEVKNADIATASVDINDINTSSGTAGNTTYLRGDGQWATPTSGSTLSGSTDNTVVTVTGANAMQGEANLTYDGNNLQHSIDSPGEGIRIKATGDHWTGFYGNANRSSADTWLVNLTGQWNDTSVGHIAILSGADTTNKDDGRIAFYTSASDGNDPVERMRIDEGGDVKINDGNLIIGTAGHGIDFSAATDVGSNETVSGSVLKDYEEGSWSMVVSGSSSGSATLSSSSCRYVKIGSLVYCVIRWDGQTMPAISGDIRLSLPFTAHDQAAGTMTHMGSSTYYYSHGDWDPGSNWAGLTLKVAANCAFATLQEEWVDSDRQGNLTTSEATGFSESGGNYFSGSVLYFTDW